jgi:hypothetical protein
VVTPVPGRPGPGVQLVLRGALQDDPQLTTPTPVVVTAATPLRPAVALLSRASYADVLPGTAALVVVQSARLRAGTAAIVRSSLVDVVVVTQVTPPPVVVAAARIPQPGRVLVSAPLSICDCLVHRPSTGTTTRASTGTTTRPSTGITTRPCSC